MSDKTESTTEAFRVQVSFNAVNQGDVVHLPVPLDAHNQALVSMGLLAPADSPVTETSSIISSGQDGEATTLLGVMPVASPRRTRRSAAPRQASEAEEADDGESDS